MIIKESVFTKSSSTYTQCPTDGLPEYAFIGRSNVGKSSLINMLCQHKGLAKTSSVPGKTQLINHFLINKEWYVVDLPGYGFARIGKEQREKWQKMVREYLQQRQSLVCVFVLIDSRLAPQRIDLEFINTLGDMQVPFVLAFTKTDKISAGKTATNVDNFLQELRNSWEERPPFFVTSAETGLGREEILSFIDNTNQSLNK